MTYALFLIRVKELNLTLQELDFLTYGMVLDMFEEKMIDNIESGIDQENKLKTTDKDIALFFGEEV